MTSVASSTAATQAEGLFRPAARFAAGVLAIGRGRVALAVAQTMLLGVTASAGLVLLIPLLTLTGIEAGFEDLGLARLVGDALSSLGVPASLPVVLAIFLAVIVSQALLARWQASVSFELQRAVTATLRDDLYEAIVRSGWPFFARQRSIDLSHTLTTLTHTAGAGVHQLIALGSGLAIAGIHLALAAYLSPAATGAALAGGLLLGVLLHRETLAARRIAEAYMSAGRALHTAAVEHLQSFKTMKSAGAEHRSARLFQQLGDHLTATQRLAVDNDNRQRFAFEVGSAVVLVLIVLLASGVARLSSGALLLLLFAFARLMPRVFGVQQNVVQVVRALPAFAEVQHLTETFRAEREHVADTMAVRPLRIERGVSLRGVSFGYECARTPVLRDVTLDIPAGRMTALVGASGAGKTTILDLLMGLLTPSAGRILVDGRPLDTMVSWRQRVGYVAQDSFVFNDTVRANLLWARPDASDATLRTALERASAWDFVMALDRGLDTVLGDRGCRLSGGERQRLALARALLGEPALLILDEATNALDRRSEDRLLDALDALRPELTIVIVAHRISCVTRADLVHLLEDGRIVESDTPAALAAQSRRFRDLHGLAPQASTLHGWTADSTT